MCNWFKTRGIITYDPNRGDMKNRTVNWCVIEVDREITRYFRWMVNRNWWEFKNKGMKQVLHQPAWDAHVSVIRGEKINNMSLWKKYHGNVVEIEYSNEIIKSGNNLDYPDLQDCFYFVEAKCPAINKIRKELNLPTCDYKGKDYKYHITIGRHY